MASVLSGSAREMNSSMCRSNSTSLILALLLVLVSSHATAQEQRAEFDGWAFVFKTDAMTDSVFPLWIETTGQVVDPCCDQAHLIVFCGSVPGIRFNAYVQKRHPEELAGNMLRTMTVRWRFDSERASPWQEWFGAIRSDINDNLFWTVDAGVTVAPQFLAQAKRSSQVRLRFRWYDGFPERDLEFSLTGYTRALAACRAAI